MALDNLGCSLTGAIKKLLKVNVIDEAAVKELVRDIQRALLQADVNVQLVLEISKRMEERALKEKVPPGISRREHNNWLTVLIFLFMENPTLKTLLKSSRKA